MKISRKNSIDLEILFQEIAHALDAAEVTRDFIRAEKLCDELIDVAKVLKKSEIIEEYQKKRLINRQ